jgi:hypothetical protein
MDGDAQLEIGLVARTFLEDLVQLALDFDAHGFGALDLAAAFAIRAVVVDGAADGFAMALAGHFHQAELADGQDVGLGFVAAQTIFDALVNLLLVATLFHVDEVEHDESAHVAQAQLATDFFGGFEVDLEDCRFLVFAAFMAASIDVDGDEGFGFVDDDIAAATEVDLTREGRFELFSDVEAVEHRLVIGVELHFVSGARREFADDFAHAIVRRRAINNDALDVFGEEVADGAFDEVGFLENAGGRGLLLDVRLDLVPLLDEHGEVANEEGFFLAFAGGAHDDAHAFGQIEFAQDFFEALALFLIFDLARNTALIGVRQEDEKTARQDDVGRDARAFGADRAFGHLNDDIASGRVEPRDVALGDARPIAAAFSAFAFDDFNSAVEGGRNDVPVVEEGILFEADVDEGGFESVFEVADFAFEDATDKAFFTGAFDGEFFENSLFDNGNARFKRLGVDDDFLLGRHAFANQALDLLDDFGGNVLDAVDEAGRGFVLELDWLIVFFFNFSRCFGIGLAILAASSTAAALLLAAALTLLAVLVRGLAFAWATWALTFSLSLAFALTFSLALARTLAFTLLALTFSLALRLGVWTLAESFVAVFVGSGVGRETGGDVLGALDFLFVPFAVKEPFGRFLTGYFGAGI